jgi:hypothetical protein
MAWQAALGLGLTLIATSPDDLPVATQQRLKLTAEMAYTFGYCANHMPAQSQKDVAELLSLKNIDWPPGTETVKADLGEAMQSFYMKGLAEKGLPNISAKSCQKILSDIGRELDAIKD